METKPPGSFLRIILADDDTDDRLFFEKALKEINIESHLTMFNDGEQLMNYLNESFKNIPDILFLDLSMPRKTGFECLTEIKENEILNELPVVVFTTSFGKDIYFENSIINTLSNIGARQYIRKPGNFKELKKIIEDALLNLIETK